MASYPHKMKIQELCEESENWKDFYEPHVLAKRTGGKKYEEVATNIGSVIYKFRIRYCNKLEGLLFNYSKYRVIYKNYIFNITSADRFEENSNEVTIIGEYNGNKN